MVTTAGNALEARSRLSEISFDLIVLDIMMPGESGLALTESLRRGAEALETPILLLTARGELDDRIAGLEAGADDYLPKPFEPRELLLRIGAILRRQPKPVEEPEYVVLGRWHFDALREELRCDDNVVKLTSAEAALLRILAAEKGGTLTREQLAERSNPPVNVRTIDVQVTRFIC